MSTYVPTNWTNNTTPSIDENNLNHLEEGVMTAHEEIELREPNLGNPTADGQVLTSTVAGIRSWTDPASGPQGEQGEQGIQGEDGIQGETGDIGVRGPRGFTGATGDDGIDGTAGADGADGATWFTETYDPTVEGKDTDLWLNVTSNEYFLKDTGTWVSQGNIKGDTGDTGGQGAQGDAGADGIDGTDGLAATVDVDPLVTKVAEGGTPTVTNTGDTTTAIFQFGVVTGDTGAQGIQGEKGNAGTGLVFQGYEDPAVVVTLTATEIGECYTANTAGVDSDGLAVAVDEVMVADNLAVPSHWVNIGAIQGPQGTQGDAGADGADGDDGNDGASATLNVGTTTTGAEGTDASVTASGTELARIFNFTIPRGDTGADGGIGLTGAKGDGWTSGYYTEETGVVTFTSADGLGFATDDLRGATGQTGADGATWYSDSVDPLPEDGVDGDFFLNTASSDYFKKIVDTWQLQGNLEGATGASGTNGTDGEGWIVNPAGEYDPATGIVTFLSDDGLGFSTTDLRGTDGSSDWDDITNKPTTYPPATHTHVGSEITTAVPDSNSIGGTPYQEVMKYNGTVVDANSIPDFGITVGLNVAHAPELGLVAIEQMKIDNTEGTDSFIAQRAYSINTASWYDRIGATTPGEAQVRAENWSTWTAWTTADDLLTQGINANRSVFDTIETEDLDNIDTSGDYYGYSTAPNAPAGVDDGILMARFATNNLFGTMTWIDWAGLVRVRTRTSNGWTAWQQVGGVTSWDEVTDKPTEFPPSAHDHTVSEIIDFPTEMAPTAHTHAQSDVTDLETDLATLQTNIDGKEPANANIQTHITTVTGNPHAVTKTEVGLGNADDTSDASKPVSTATQTALDLKFDESDHVEFSAGVADAGKPIILTGQGQLDPSLVSSNAFRPIAPWTPVAGTEYPDTATSTAGDFWWIEGVTDPYTFVDAGGDLEGRQIRNGDFMVWTLDGWHIMIGEMNPLLYYKLDGTSSITADFQGGGKQIVNIIDGVADTDGATVGQMNTGLAGKVDDAQVQTDVPAGALFTDTVYDDTAIQAEVTLNTAKTGITTTQADDITANNAKVGITTTQSDDITENNAKISYDDATLVAQHTTDIADNVTAIAGKAPTVHTHTKSQISDWAHEHPVSEISDFPATMPPSEHGHTTDQIVDLDTAQEAQDTAIALNTAKVGITTTQASDITANNAKVTGADRVLQTEYDTDQGTQDTAIALNTAKVGYTDAAVTANASVTANTAKVGVTTEVKSEPVTTGANIPNMISITQAEYDALTPVADTLYVISDPSIDKSKATAWVSFDGKTGGVATIVSSFNIASVVRDSAGTYTVTFTTPMTGDYTVTSSASLEMVVSAPRNVGCEIMDRTATTCLVVTSYPQSSVVDSGMVDLIFFGGL